MRSYNQYCGVAKALDLVGQRWALLIVRDLLPGPRRFSDLIRPGLTPNVLTTRLHELRDAGLLEATTLPPPGARKVWRLTEAGQRLRPVVLALGHFGATYMGSTEGHTTDVRWFVVSLERRWVPSGAKGVVQLIVDDVPYRVQLTERGARVSDGLTDRPDATWRGSASELFQAVRTGPRPADPSGLLANLFDGIAAPG
ncbi:MAG: helix-turn-helix domain-containing protein [Myxococcota bacterium]